MRRGARRDCDFPICAVSPPPPETTDEDVRANLVRLRNLYHQQLVTCTPEDRNGIIQKKTAVEKRIHDIRPKLKRPSVGFFSIDAAREILAPRDFQPIYVAATLEWEANKEHREKLSAEMERRANLVNEVQSYQKQLNERLSQEARRTIGVRMLDIQTEINAIGPIRKVPSLADYFIQAAKSVLAKPVFKLVIDEAAARMRVANGQADPDQAHPS